MSLALNLKDNYSTVKWSRTVNAVPEIIAKKESYTSVKTKASAIALPLIATPTLASAADTFGDIHSTAMALFDGAVVLIIIFAGASWALGHRSKAIEILVGVCCGYLLARHAVDIRDYLKSIG